MIYHKVRLSRTDQSCRPTAKSTRCYLIKHWSISFDSEDPTDAVCIRQVKIQCKLLNQNRVRERATEDPWFDPTAETSDKTKKKTSTVKNRVKSFWCPQLGEELYGSYGNLKNNLHCEDFVTSPNVIISLISNPERQRSGKEEESQAYTNLIRRRKRRRLS